MTNERYDRMIDTALQSYPLAPLPKGFVARTMQQTARPRFRLNFVDIVVPLFFSVFGIFALLLSLWFWSYIDPLWLAELQLRLTMARLYISVEPISFVIGLGVVMGVVVFMGIALVYLFVYRSRISLKLRLYN